MHTFFVFWRLQLRLSEREICQLLEMRRSLSQVPNQIRVYCLKHATRGYLKVFSSIQHSETKPHSTLCNEVEEASLKTNNKLII
jgi:hypothetical protein